MFNGRYVGHTCRIVHFYFVAVFIVNKVRHVRYGGYYVHVKFAVEAFLHNFHVQQS